MGITRSHATALGAAGLVALAVVAALVLRSSGLSGTRTRGAPGDSAAKQVPAAPEDLLCDVVVPTPNAAWTRLQRGVGGAAGILPTTLPGVVVTLADLDVRVSAELDGTSPMYGALTGELADPGFAVAMKLVDERHARGSLVDSDSSPYAADPQAGTGKGMTVLVSRAARSAASRLGYAMTDNGYFLVTRRPADLARLGPYVTRALPARLPRTDALVVEAPRSALAKRLVPALAALWKDEKTYLLAEDQRMRAERGRAPDFGDPAAIVAAVDDVVARRLGTLADLERARLSLTVGDDSVGLAIALAPVITPPGPAKAWVDGMPVGDASAVLALPSDSLFAFSSRDRESDRVAQGADLERGVTSALGPRLHDPAKIHQAIDALTKARGDSFALAFAHGDAGGLLVRAATPDADAAARAMKDAVDLATTETFKELLRVRELKTAEVDVPAVGKVEVATAAREPTPSASKDTKKGTITPPPFGVAWVPRPGVLLVAAGSDPTRTLAAGASPPRTLADERPLERFRLAVGADAATIAILQPLRLDPGRVGASAAPVAVALGRRQGEAFLLVDAPDVILREALRWQMGF